MGPLSLDGLQSIRTNGSLFAAIQTAHRNSPIIPSLWNERLLISSDVISISRVSTRFFTILVSEVRILTYCTGCLTVKYEILEKNESGDAPTTPTPEFMALDENRCAEEKPTYQDVGVQFRAGRLTYKQWTNSALRREFLTRGMIVLKMCNKSTLVGKFKLSDGYVDYYRWTARRLREECTKRNLGIGHKKNMVNRLRSHDRQSRGGK